MESVGASEVYLKRTSPTSLSPDESTTPDAIEMDYEDENWRSAVERGDTIQLKRKSKDISAAKAESSATDAKLAVISGDEV